MDNHRLLQIGSNLISNTIKYSPDGGAMEVITYQRAATVRITIILYGRGAIYRALLWR